MPIGDLATSVGFKGAYDTFYVESSSITHGGSLPLLTPRYGVGCKDLDATAETAEGRDYGTMALLFATHFVFSLFQKANEGLRLEYDDLLQESWKKFRSLGWFVDPPRPTGM